MPVVITSLLNLVQGGLASVVTEKKKQKEKGQEETTPWLFIDGRYIDTINIEKDRKTWELIRVLELT